MIGPALVVKMHSKLTDIMDITEKQKQNLYIIAWSSCEAEYVTLSRTVTQEAKFDASSWW